MRLAAFASIAVCMIIAAACAGKAAGPLPPAASPASGKAALPEEAMKRCRNANLIIVVMDAAQAGHCSAYGYARKTTPRLERLAAEGVLFRDVVCSFPSTPPGVKGMLWGMRLLRAPTPEEKSFVQALKSAGYKTCGATSNFVARGAMGNVGFDDILFSSGPALKRGEKPTPEQEAEIRAAISAESVLRIALEWLEKNKEERFFLYLHFLEPHNPYWPPEPWRRMFWGGKPAGIGDSRTADLMALGYHSAKKRPDAAMEEAIALYDGNLAYSDDHVGKLWEKLGEMGLLEKTVLVVTADHGEGWGEHGDYAHNSSVYDEEVHIPLVIRFPAGIQPRHKEVEGLVEQVDLAPSLAELLGVELTSLKPDGASFWPLVFGDEKQMKEYAFIQSGRFILGGGEANKPFYALRTPRYKYILDSVTGKTQLYDMKWDPGETENLIEDLPGLEAALAGYFGLASSAAGPG
jgi:arylsulfatase A-like enzyme